MLQCHCLYFVLKGSQQHELLWQLNPLVTWLAWCASLKCDKLETSFKFLFLKISMYWNVNGHLARISVEDDSEDNLQISDYRQISGLSHSFTYRIEDVFWTMRTSKLADPFSFSPSYCRLRPMFSVTPCRLSTRATRGCHIHRLQWLGRRSTLVLTRSLVSWSWHLVTWSSFLVMELRRSLPMFLNI